MRGNKNPAKRHDVRKKISENRKKSFTQEEKDAISKRMKGVPKTKRCKDRISKTKTGVPNFSSRGEKCILWKGGVSKENKKERNSIKYSTWRRQVFERDDYTCRKCGDRGYRLHAHHIKNFSSNPNSRYLLINGITFCRECHREFHKQYGVTNNTLKQIKQYLK